MNKPHPITLNLGQEIELVDGRHFIVEALLDGAMVKMRHLSDTYSITTSSGNIRGLALSTAAMIAAPEMEALEAFGLNPKTVTETLQRIHRAMHADGLTQADINAQVLSAYMEADRKTQERMFMAYMTDPRTRQRVQAAILDILEEGTA